MIEQRRLANQGKHLYRVYRATDADELIRLQEKYQTHYKRSVEILKPCDFLSDNDLTEMERMADDWAYKSLNLKSGDLCMITKELSFLKLEDDTRYEKQKKLHKVTPSTHLWTEEQLVHLWHGKAEVVAKIVNKSADAVERKRKEYLNEHTDFVYPEDCKTPRKNAKIVVLKNKEWKEEEIKILFSMSGKKLGGLLNKTIFEVSERRHQYCVEHPEFIIPACADYKKGDLPNAVEDRRKNRKPEEKVQKAELQAEPKADDKKYFWSDEEKDLLWKHDIDYLANKFPKRSPAAFYSARIKYLNEHPAFVIPRSAGWVPRKYRSRLEPEIPVQPVEQQPAVTAPIVEQPKSDDLSEATKVMAFINQLPPEQRPKKIHIGSIVLEF